jgi:hypothetical protein
MGCSFLKTLLKPALRVCLNSTSPACSIMCHTEASPARLNPCTPTGRLRAWLSSCSRGRGYAFSLDFWLDLCSLAEILADLLSFGRFRNTARYAYSDPVTLAKVGPCAFNKFPVFNLVGVVRRRHDDSDVGPTL